MTAISSDLFLIHINMYRNYPKEYKQYFNITNANCNDLVPVDALYKNDELTLSSLFQANTLSFNNCTTISHDTCSLYLARFHNDPRYSTRISSFLGNDSQISIAGEVLAKGLFNIRRIMFEFIRSEPHCYMIRCPYANIIGSSLVKNEKKIFIADFGRDNDRLHNASFFYTACERFNQSSEIFVVDSSSPNELQVIANNRSMHMSLIIGKNYFYKQINHYLDSYIIYNQSFPCYDSGYA
jgi:hypothetical protein